MSEWNTNLAGDLNRYEFLLFDGTSLGPIGRGIFPTVRAWVFERNITASSNLEYCRGSFESLSRCGFDKDGSERGSLPPFSLLPGIFTGVYKINVLLWQAYLFQYDVR